MGGYFFLLSFTAIAMIDTIRLNSIKSSVVVMPTTPFQRTQINRLPLCSVLRYYYIIAEIFCQYSLKYKLPVNHGQFLFISEFYIHFYHHKTGNIMLNILKASSILACASFIVPLLCRNFYILFCQSIDFYIPFYLY